MDEAAATRRAAHDAIADVEPAGLRERIARQLDDGSMVPGIVTILTARETGTGPDGTLSGEPLSEPIACRAAGVQLIYDGLRLTRSLSQDEPWTRADLEKTPEAIEDATTEANLAILVADVMVARGFYLLARTEAADRAVETVRSFGRDQTLRAETGESALDTNLERDVLELAVVGGATLDGTVTPGLREFAADLGEEVSDASFAALEHSLADSVTDRLSTVSTETASSGGVTTSVDD